MLSDEEFRLFRNMIYDESGMYLKDSKKDFLEHRVLKRMRATNTATPYWYYRHLMANRKAELLILLDIMTINETSFFRNLPQFELFQRVIVPALRSQRERRGERKLRIWSAGCSTGEEPYTIAIVLREAVPGIDAWDVKVLASDLSLTVLNTAHRGVYPGNKVDEMVPRHLIGKHFHREGNDYRVSDEVKKLVAFDFHNLKHENGVAALDAIFCRNVMIYFNEEEQLKLVNKFFRSLLPGGYLLLGHAESLHGLDTGFEFVYENKGTAYRKPWNERKEATE